MRYLKAASFLVAMALGVTLGVMGLGAVMFPEQPASRAGIAADDAGSPTSSPTGTRHGPPTPAGRPTDLGGVLEVTGDRPGTIVLERRHMNYGSGRYQIGDGSATFYMEHDPENGWHTTQATYSGLNLFPDPQECSFEPIDGNEQAGVARFDVSCPTLTDVRGAETISIAGWIDGPLLFSSTDGRYDSGGTLTVSGDIDAEMYFPSAVWYRYPEGWLEDDPDATGVTISNFDDDFQSLRVLFDPEDGSPAVTVLGLDQSIFRAEDCDVSLESEIKVAPNTDLLTLDVDCALLTEIEGPARISATGTIRLHRVSVELDARGRPLF